MYCISVIPFPSSLLVCLLCCAPRLKLFSLKLQFEEFWSSFVKNQPILIFLSQFPPFFVETVKGNEILVKKQLEKRTLVKIHVNWKAAFHLTSFPSHTDDHMQISKCLLFPNDAHRARSVKPSCRLLPLLPIL